MKHIEAEDGELVLKHKDGSIAIIPKENRSKVLLALHNGNDSYIDRLVTKLPKMSSYAEDGTLIPQGNEDNFDDWYKTVPKEKNDTTSYNLRRAYELAPKEQLDAFVSDPKAHLYSVYENKETGIYEFMKSKNHPTINKELDWYNADTPESRTFRRKYDLDTSGEYYKYIPRKNFIKN